MDYIIQNKTQELTPTEERAIAQYIDFALANGYTNVKYITFGNTEILILKRPLWEKIKRIWKRK